MAYTALKLITGAYYASGVRARDFESVTASDINEGLSFLNDVLQENTLDFAMIPYYTKYTFDAISGQQTYFIENLIDIDTLTFFINSVRYSMQKQNRKAYHGNSRAEDILSLPFDWEIDRCKGGANLNMYFLPDQNYPMELWGTFRLEHIDNPLYDMEDVYDRFYIDYIRFFLANRLCVEFNTDVPTGCKMQLMQYHKLISKRSAPLDLTMTVINTVGQALTMNYAQANIGKAFTVSSGF